MQHIIGIPRNQMFFSPEASGLEDRISADNPIRFIDAFIETIALESLGFSQTEIGSNYSGRST